MKLKEILEKLACKELSIDEAEKLLQGDLISTAIEEVDDIAKLDLYRQARTGIPEVILAEGKRPKDAALLAVKMASKSGYTLVSRISDEVIEEIKPILPDSLEIAINERARMLIVKKKGYEYKTFPGKIGIFAAGTSDIPVAREAYLTAENMGNQVEAVFDVGVAGIHRLFNYKKKIDDASVLVVVAGMEGALPSVVAGMVSRPVIAVPTSIGYGVSLGGLTALFAMLNSCSSNVAVVNIDNGFGAGYTAGIINGVIEKSNFLD